MGPVIFVARYRAKFLVISTGSSAPGTSKKPPNPLC
nr:MAG TPA: FAD-NAD(P)-binding [Caudoviricetes sp.]